MKISSILGYQKPGCYNCENNYGNASQVVCTSQTLSLGPEDPWMFLFSSPCYFHIWQNIKTKPPVMFKIAYTFSKSPGTFKLSYLDGC